MSTLTGRTAFVTGGTSGIGRAIVEHLTDAGMLVAFTGRDGNRGVVVAAATRAAYIRADATDRHATDEAFEQALAFLGGRIDVFVASAAIVYGGPLETTPEEVFRELVEVNLTSTFRYSRSCFEAMREQGGGSIVHIVSDAAIRGIHGIPAYSTTKAGVLALSEALAAEGAPHGVRVNAVCPGAVFPGVQSTPRGHEQHAEDASTWGPAPSGRHGRAADVARTVRWLASDEAEHVSGATLRVDGAASAAMRAGARA